MKKLLILLFLVCSAAIAQTRITPDCDIPFSFTATGDTPNSTCGAPNGSPNNAGITTWVVVYYNSGFSGLSLTVQSAPDSAGSPGSWATFAGTVLTTSQCPGSSGINPNTAITSAYTCLAGYFPWMRVDLSGLTGSGTVNGHLYGYLNSTVARGGGGGGSIAPCTVDSSGDLACPGTVASGSAGGITGAFAMVGATSGATSTVTVDATNIATTVKLPNDAASGLYLDTSPTATPGAGCAQFSGTSTEITSTSKPCGAGSSLFSTINSTTVTATSPTTLIGTVSGSTTVPANTFTAGQVMEVMAQGFYSTPATPASLTITLNVGGTIRLTTGAVVQIASVTNGTWRFWCGVTTRTAGISGTQIANCIFEGTGATLTPGESPMATSSTWTIDTTSTQAIDFVATWSTSTGAPTITSTNVAAWFVGNSSSGGGGSNISFGAFSSLPGSCAHSATASDEYLSQPYTFVCTSTNTFTPYYHGFQTTLPPSSVTFVNQNGSTYSRTNGYGQITLPQDNGQITVVEMITSVPATPYKYYARVSWQVSSADFSHSQLCLFESSSNKALTAGIMHSGFFSLSADNWTSLSSVSNIAQAQAPPLSADVVYFVADDGINVSSGWSFDGGVTFYTIANATRGTYFTTAPDKVGFCLDKDNFANTNDFITVWGLEQH